MEIKRSDLIRKISELKNKPVRISGHVVPEDDAEEITIKVYPELDPGRYYVVEKSCIIEVLPADEEDRLTILVDPTCDIECVSRKRLSAADLDRKFAQTTCCKDPLPETMAKASKEACAEIRALSHNLDLIAIDVDRDYPPGPEKDKLTELIREQRRRYEHFLVYHCA